MGADCLWAQRTEAALEGINRACRHYLFGQSVPCRDCPCDGAQILARSASTCMLKFMRVLMRVSRLFFTRKKPNVSRTDNDVTVNHLVKEAETLVLAALFKRFQLEIPAQGSNAAPLTWSPVEDPTDGPALDLFDLLDAVLTDWIPDSGTVLKARPNKANIGHLFHFRRGTTQVALEESQFSTSSSCDVMDMVREGQGVTNQDT